MLHILTALYRFENLDKIQTSIPMNVDIIWHICKSNKREDITNENILKDKQIKIHNTDCEDTDLVSKRIELLKSVTDGYFCFLDDDTIFLEKMYEKYLEATENNFIGMLIGEQVYPHGELRLIAGPPVQNAIDIGNVLCHFSCLKIVEWPKIKPNDFFQRDFLFWDSVYNFYGKKCAILNQPISCYNKLSENREWTKEEKLSELLKKTKKNGSKKKNYKHN